MTNNARTPASDELVAELYENLRQIARRERYRAGSPATLQTTAVLNEAYIKLRRADAWESRSHFMAVACTTMRHVLVDAARARLAARRTADPVLVAELHDGVGDTDTIRINDALSDLAAFDGELARLVEYRFFVGLDEREIGALMGISERTVRRRWTQARAWIHAALSDEN